MEFKLNLDNLEWKKGIEVYLYTREHVVIPRYFTGVYGSTMKILKMVKDTGYYWRFYVRKNRVMALDRSGQRCSYNSNEESVGRCIVRKLEDAHNCTSYQLTANKTKEFCTISSGVMGKFQDTINDYWQMSEADLFNNTGCMPSCDRYEMSLVNTPDSKTFKARSRFMTLVFLFEDGSYNLREEYIVYDTSNFMADVGGYLGLLLGQSILSIYYLSIDWLTSVKIWRYLMLNNCCRYS